MNEKKIHGKIYSVAISEIIPYEKNPRKIPEKAVTAVALSIRNFGVQQPIVLDENNVVVCGHTRLLAAKRLRLKSFPCVYAMKSKDVFLTENECRAYRIADNRANDFATFDAGILTDEFLRIELPEGISFADYTLFEKVLAEVSEKHNADEAIVSDIRDKKYTVSATFTDSVEAEKLYGEMRKRGYVCDIVVE